MRHAQEIRLKFRWTREYGRERYDGVKEILIVSECESNRATYVVTKGTMTWIHAGNFLEQLSKEGWKIIRERLS